jgi:hypothetical protein
MESLDLLKFKELLENEKFVTIYRKLPPRGDGMISLYNDKNWGELRIKADNLYCNINPLLAVLFQKEKSSFTDKDLKLREIILRNYPHERNTPFPWSYTNEPKFEIEKKRF